MCTAPPLDPLTTDRPSGLNAALTQKLAARPPANVAQGAARSREAVG
jgi:hypothetical protein